jgi:hypothetical protein
MSADGGLRRRVAVRPYFPDRRERDLLSMVLRRAQPTLDQRVDPGYLLRRRSPHQRTGVSTF